MLVKAYGNPSRSGGPAQCRAAPARGGRTANAHLLLGGRTRRVVDLHRVDGDGDGATGPGKVGPTWHRGHGRRGGGSRGSGPAAAAAAMAAEAALSSSSLTTLSLSLSSVMGGGCFGAAAAAAATVRKPSSSVDSDTLFFSFFSLFLFPLRNDIITAVANWRCAR